MIYQDILLGADPFLVFINQSSEYPIHTHYELEIVYCLSGTITAKIEDVTYTISAGEAICINSMTRHGFEYNSTNAEQLVIEFGPSFIGESFQFLKNIPFDSKHFKNCADNENIISTLVAIVNAYRSNKKIAPIIIKSELFRLFALIYENVSHATEDTPPSEARAHSELKEKIDKALTIIRHRYNEPISVNEAAQICGYSVSSFCNTFKKYTGVSFHGHLNAYRVEKSKELLSITNMSIEEIAESVGFLDAKSFCRAFKRETETSPGEYRKNKTNTP